MRFSSASSAGQVSLTNLGMQRVFRNVCHGLCRLFAWLVVRFFGLLVVWLGLWVSVVAPFAGEPGGQAKKGLKDWGRVVTMGNGCPDWYALVYMCGSVFFATGYTPIEGNQEIQTEAD